jgi:hypothetical protein
VSGTLVTFWDTLKEIGDTSVTTLAVSVAVIATVVVFGRWMKAIPGGLAAVVGAITVSWAFDLSTHGVAVLGPVPSGLPDLGLPSGVGWGDAPKLLATSASMFVVIIAQSAATSRAYAVKYALRAPPPQARPRTTIEGATPSRSTTAGARSPKQRSTSSSNPLGARSVPAVGEEPGMRELAAELVDRARSEGVELTGESGRLTALVRQVLQTGLEVEMTDHLSYEPRPRKVRGLGTPATGTTPRTAATSPHS